MISSLQEDTYKCTLIRRQKQLQRIPSILCDIRHEIDDYMGRMALYLEDVHGDAGARLPELQEIGIAKELPFLVPVPCHCCEVTSLPASLHGHVGELLWRGATGETVPSID